MSKKSKLSHANKHLNNIDTIKSVLAGEHNSNYKTIHTIEDTEAKTQNESNVGKFSELRKEINKFANCRKSECTCLNPLALDIKFNMLKGMCMECVADEETQMKLEGTWNEYESSQIKNNIMYHLALTMYERDKMIVMLNNPSYFFQGDGQFETWINENPELAKERILSQFNKDIEYVMTTYNITEDEVMEYVKTKK